MPIRGSSGSLVLGVLAAVGASVCCVGPLLLLTLGIGGAWIGNLTAFEPYRPIFIGLVLLFFGLAFRRLYVAKQVCTAGSLCNGPVGLSRQRLVFWLVAVFALCLLAVPITAPLLM